MIFGNVVTFIFNFGIFLCKVFKKRVISEESTNFFFPEGNLVFFFYYGEVIKKVYSKKKVYDKLQLSDRPAYN